MKLMKRTGASIAVIAILSACTVTPERNEILEQARTIVPEIENSGRAGIAAADVSNARKSLDTANRLADSRGKRADVEFEAQNAVTSAQIAREKILTAEANESIERGTAQRQAVLLESREREVQRSAQNAQDARQGASDAEALANASKLRADSLESQLADLKAKRTERGLVLTLGDVLFDTGGATLKSGAYATLDRLASALKDKSGRSVTIEGHTDDVGSDAANEALSLRRAESVQMALMQRGVASAQMQVMGRGEMTPVAGNDNIAGRQQNRRVELIFADTANVAADGN